MAALGSRRLDRTVVLEAAAGIVLSHMLMYDSVVQFRPLARRHAITRCKTAVAQASNNSTKTLKDSVLHNPQQRFPRL